MVAGVDYDHRRALLEFDAEGDVGGSERVPANHKAQGLLRILPNNAPHGFCRDGKQTPGLLRLGVEILLA